MNEEGYAFFASRVPKDARVAFESTIMAYAISRALRGRGYRDITVATLRRLRESLEARRTIQWIA